VSTHVHSPGTELFGLELSRSGAAQPGPSNRGISGAFRARITFFRREEPHGAPEGALAQPRSRMVHDDAEPGMSVG